LKTLTRLLDLLTAAERRRVILLIAMIVVMAMLDAIGVALIMPFMAMVANPRVVESEHYLAKIYQALGFTDPQAFLSFLGLALIVALLVSIAFRALTTYAHQRFTLMREYAIGRRLVAGYLHQPYEWFLNRHSADLGKMVLSEVSQVINFTMVPMMDLIAQGALVTVLLTLLIVTDSTVALAVGVGLGAAYLLIYGFLRGYLGRIGADRVQANKQRFELLSEAFGGIKDVKVSGLEEFFLHRFDRPGRRYARYQTAVQLAAQLPRFALEAVAFLGLVLVLLYHMRGPGGLETALPIIALYGFASYRLMPAVQRIYSGLSSLRYGSAALEALHHELGGLSAPQEGMAPPRTMRVEGDIRLERISYTYPNAEQPTLEDFSLSIPAHSAVGLVGLTGSGKTTAVDLILGLLRAQQGALKVDDVTITSQNVRAWQRAIGYVSQHIYLADGSIAGNIAFGIPKDQIDYCAVERAARIANLHDFVTSTLPQAYETAVGERGVRLSGGERQRIGIARALYHGPQVLILDEATSALDNVTEQAVMESVHNLGREITVILIAHRLSTVARCDRIYLLEQGRVADVGTYAELLAQSSRFREMAGVPTAAPGG
jgi:ABC-type multidrug transport system fused ATPase/permease subunit